MLTTLDYVAIGFYFAFMLGLGWYFRRAATDSSDYFRGGGVMPWWLVGASAFMMSFSAWTFTGSAGLAFERGFIVLTIYWANAVAAFFLAWTFAPSFRQLRLISPIEAVRQRLGVTNEQIGIWVGFPVSILSTAIWLYGLAIFLAPVFHLDLNTIIVGAGVVVVLVSAAGGSWAVITGDFMQTLLLMPITLVAAWLALVRVGGVKPLLNALPPEHFDLTSSHLPGFGVLWLTALLLQKLLAQNISASGKFLCVADGREARRASIFHGVLMLVGSLTWFIPPLVARALHLDLAAQYPDLSKPAEAAYVAVAIQTLPPGLLGLLVTGLIAATVSSMDTGLNANAGMLVRGFYLPILRPKASERELVFVGQVVTALMGALIVLLALHYTTWKGLGVFTIMFNVTAMLMLPSMVPGFWCLLTRRSPDWAYWSTMLFGLAISALFGLVPRQEAFLAWAKGAGFGEAVAWFRTNEFGALTLLNTTACSAWFWGITWLMRRNPLPPARQAQVDEFFCNLRRPLSTAEIGDGMPDARTRTIARMCYCYGAFVLLLAIFPNTMSGRVGLVFCSAFLLGTGGLIDWLLRRRMRAACSAPRTATPDYVSSRS